MLSIHEIRARLADANLAKVSRSSGIPLATLYRVANGRTPSYITLERISQYLARRDANLGDNE